MELIYLSQGHNLRAAAFQTFADFINTKQRSEPQCLLGTQLCSEKVSLMGGLVAKKGDSTSTACLPFSLIRAYTEW